MFVKRQVHCVSESTRPEFRIGRECIPVASIDRRGMGGIPKYAEDKIVSIRERWNGVWLIQKLREVFASPRVVSDNANPNNLPFIRLEPPDRDLNVIRELRRVDILRKVCAPPPRRFIDKLSVPKDHVRQPWEFLAIRRERRRQRPPLAVRAGVSETDAHANPIARNATSNVRPNTEHPSDKR